MMSEVPTPHSPPNAMPKSARRHRKVASVGAKADSTSIRE
ncbi:hypothetical protein KMAL_27650 [Novacetimonas maltaceti]|uniref:Uncharacterized protein n=1 Tax=Novacetimonas maltaceti TaxID=1203393 RepID=A0A2S3VYB9_9PROT|nr:hypothetical protein KMAL_27650 [Novacetimonas maltaceti]